MLPFSVRRGRVEVDAYLLVAADAAAADVLDVVGDWRMRGVERRIGRDAERNIASERVVGDSICRWRRGDGEVRYARVASGMGREELKR